MTTPRELTWDGYFNARDLGGLSTPLASTGRTASGRVARGPRRERLTTAGWHAAVEWGLTSIVDLRCAYEAGVREGDPAVAPEVFSDIVITNAPTEDQSDPEFREVCFPILDSPEYWSHNWRLQPGLIRGALEAIASAPGGVLIHCSAGRDRTGMMSALLLGNAGVDPDVVTADYEASVRAMAGTAHHGPTTDRQSRWSQKQVTEWLIDKLPIVRDVAANTHIIFDSIGVELPVRDALRAKLI